MIKSGKIDLDFFLKFPMVHYNKRNSCLLLLLSETTIHYCEIDWLMKFSDAIFPQSYCKETSVSGRNNLRKNIFFTENGSY